MRHQSFNTLRRPQPQVARLSAVVALGLALLVAPEAQAQWMISAYGGAVRTAQADIRVDQPARGTSVTFPDVPFRSRSFESPIYYGYRIARSLPRVRWLYIEGELIHAKVYAIRNQAPAGHGTLDGVLSQNLPFSSLVQEFALSHGLNFILVNGVVRRALGGDRVALTGRAGIGPMLPHREIEISGQRNDGYQLAGTGVQAAAGVELRVWRAVAVIAEYKWTRARPRLSIPDGWAVVTTRSDHLATGVSISF